MSPVAIPVESPASNMPSASNCPVAPVVVLALLSLSRFVQEAGLILSLGKATVINLALQDIGMGRYQWQLFILCGFGWFADKYVLCSS